MRSGLRPACSRRQSAINSFLMQLCPSLYEPTLFFWQRTRYCFNRIDLIDGYMLLIIRMEMRFMMRSAKFCIHADNDTEEAR